MSAPVDRSFKQRCNRPDIAGRLILAVLDLGLFLLGMAVGWGIGQ
jgi:hypothetical protein